MALIKGSKVNKSGVVLVQGDLVIVEETRAPARGRPKAPAGPLKVDPLIVGGTPPGFAAEEHAPDWAAPPGLAGATEAAGERPPEPYTGADPVAQWDMARDHLLESAHAQADVAAEEAAGEVNNAAEVYDEVFQDAAERIAGVLGDGSEGEQALDAIVPALERQAAARAELEAVAAAARSRWRLLASAEEQIAALLANFELPEGAAAKVLAEREEVLAEARLQAGRILTEAQEEAARIRADAESQGAQALEDFELTRQERFEQLREEARAAGYTEGRAQADEEGARIIEEAIETLNRARLSYPRAVKENQEKLLELSLQVAEKIIGEEVAARPDLVLQTLDVALTRVTDLESVTIRVNPEDLPLVAAQEDQYREMLAQVRKLEFVASQKIQRGGVFIETSSGSVDATIKTQLSVVAEIFRTVRKEIENAADADSEAFEELDAEDA